MIILPSSALSGAWRRWNDEKQESAVRAGSRRSPRARTTAFQIVFRYYSSLLELY